MGSRIFNDDRRRQGFKSQPHLDAFYAYVDHTVACAECNRPGKPVLLSDGYQPTLRRCHTAKLLSAAFHLLNREFALKTASGYKIQSRITRLLRYVNNHVEHIEPGNPIEKETAKWAQKTIEQGIVNIAQNCFADRIS